MRKRKRVQKDGRSVPDKFGIDYSDMHYTNEYLKRNGGKRSVEEHFDSLLTELPRHTRFVRLLGSLVFIVAGAFFLVFPPEASQIFFERNILAYGEGAVFIAGGLLSLWGVAGRRIETERLGVSLVVISSALLVFVQAILMLSFPVTLGMGGEVFAYLGLTLWAVDRWKFLGRVINTIDVAERIGRERQIPPFDDERDQ